MKKSIIAFIVFLVLGLLAMGATGFAIYYLVAPVLLLFFPAPDAWHGDWVWPATIIAGINWAFGFLIAGWLHKKLTARHINTILKRSAYTAVLWLWALLIWSVILADQFGTPSDL